MIIVDLCLVDLELEVESKLKVTIIIMLYDRMWRGRVW